MVLDGPARTAKDDNNSAVKMHRRLAISPATSMVLSGASSQ